MKQTVIVLNLANFTGTLNHLGNTNGNKVRVDYKAMLEYLAGDKKVVTAFAVSQKDIHYRHSDKNDFFLKNLGRLGWTPHTITYDSTNDESVNNVNNIIATSLVDLIAERSLTPENTEFVFVTGSSGWVPIVDYVASLGYSIEVAYVRSATTKILYTDYPFFDISKFVMQSNEVIVSAHNNKS